MAVTNTLTAQEALDISDGASQTKLDVIMELTLGRVYDAIRERAEEGFEEVDITFTVYLDNTGRMRGNLPLMERLREALVAELETQGYTNVIDAKSHTQLAKNPQLAKKLASNAANLQRYWSHIVAWGPVKPGNPNE